MLQLSDKNVGQVPVGLGTRLLQGYTWVLQLSLLGNRSGPAVFTLPNERLGGPRGWGCTFFVTPGGAWLYLQVHVPATPYTSISCTWLFIVLGLPSVLSMGFTLAYSQANKIILNSR